MRFIRLWAALILLAGISSATDFMPIVPITAVTVGIFLALMFMLSEAMANPQLTAWAKGELREFVAALILVVIIYAVFISPVGLAPLTQAITGQDDYITVSLNIIDNMLGNETSGFDTAYKGIIRAASKIRIGASYAPWISIPLWIIALNYSVVPYSGISIVLTALGTATHNLTNVIFLYEGLRLLILFFRATVPTIILPLALALRLIPFGRKVGNTVIAVSLAAIVLLPFSVILVGEINKLIDYPDVQLHNADDLDARPWAMEFGSVFCAIKPIRFILSLNEYGFAFLACGWLLLIFPWGTALFPGCFMAVANVVYPIVNDIIKIIQTVVLLIWMIVAEVQMSRGTGWQTDVMDILIPFMKNVNNLVLVGYIDAIIIAIITISGARSISTALGGEWYLAGVERLI